MSIGMIHGRFQPFHNGHLEYLEAAAALSQTLIVGITNPDPSTVRLEPEDEQRHLRDSNPFSYIDRYRMVRGAAFEVGLDLRQLDIVPFPINDRTLWQYYLPVGVTQYIRVFSPWGERKRQLLARAGFTVVDLAIGAAKVHSGDQVRSAMSQGSEWRHMVPSEVARVIDDAAIEAG